MRIKLICVNKSIENQQWSIKLDGERVVLYNSHGQVVAEYDHEDAPAHFQMPSFSESIKTFGVYVKGHLIRFNVDKPGLKELKLYLNAHLAASGPEALRAKRNKALSFLAAGVLLTSLCIVAVVLKIMFTNQFSDGGLFTITVMGLVTLGKGVYDFIQYGKSKKLAGVLH